MGLKLFFSKQLCQRENIHVLIWNINDHTLTWMYLHLIMAMMCNNIQTIIKIKDSIDEENLLSTVIISCIVIALLLGHGFVNIHLVHLQLKEPKRMSCK